MKIRVILLACALAMPATASFAAEHYRCSLIITRDLFNPVVDYDQYVRLTIDGKIVRPIIHIADASKNLTFKSCKALRNDGSNFYGWFGTECRDLAAADGSPFTTDVYLVGAYGGVSPIIDKRYSRYEIIAGVSRRLGFSVPPRTFAIFVESKPVYEFFCYATPHKH
jgi:hypothetical protein